MDTNHSKEKLIAEIERLRKELKKKKRYGLVWEDKPEEVAEICKTKLPVLREVKDKEIITDKDNPVNLLIEGDNYHALSVLNYTHKGRLDVIYIDPPYNTGAKDWKYNNDYVDINDSYRHSKWLSMMSKRLRLAKNLLKQDGVLICAIDDNEFYHLGTLLEEIFYSHEIHCVTIVHNPRGIQGNNFSYMHEYAYFVFRKGLKVIGSKQRDEILEEELRDHGGESLRTDARNCFYPILVENKQIVGFGDVPSKEFHPKSKNIKRKNNIIEVWPIDSKGIERKWVFALQTVNEIKGKLFIKEKKNGEIDIFRRKDTQKPRTVWNGQKYDASTFGSKIVNGLTGTSFPFPKSLYNTKDCLECVIRERKKAIILDYFAGSGTTGHAVMLLNKEDQGQREFILCTNNENKIAEDVCYPRIKKVIKGHNDYLDITGIPANLKYFRTTFVDAEPTDKNKKKLTAEATEMLCIKEGTFEPVLEKKDFKIFKNSKHYTGIVFDSLAIDDFKKAIKSIQAKFSVYIFSLGDDTFDEEFEDIRQKVKLSPIPEVILRVYRRIFKR
ncbi:MAG TPA: site-specific DNA-methyltransferase [Candidatus Wunengus sp. YC60]|uniref:site-specific DNA-methyltransferase n=1 Tax=Candidatus Wunengus sp. YC60 TaxID=3367697 RepID=UPI0040284832